MNKKPTKRKSNPLICSNCGAENPKNATNCKKCNKDKFEPGWVRAKRSINRQVSVQITTPDPKYGEAPDRITLSKWWPGGRSSFNIPNPAQWLKISSIINNELAPFLGWKTAKTLAQEAVQKSSNGFEVSETMSELLAQHPDFLKKLVNSIDPKKLSASNLEPLMELLGEIADAYSTTNLGFRDAFISIVRKLPKQKQRAIEDLDILLKTWSLQVVTNVAQQVKLRLETIDLFEKQILDDRTYEILGDNSIHRILERAMWLIDERYWLMFSNKTLRSQIGDEMSKRDKRKYGKKRPDFVCGTIDNTLIILELKRPKHTLNLEDLNQLEIYLTIAEDYSSFRSYHAYLVGAKKHPELERHLKHRSSSFKILTYADLISDTKTRYHDFIKSLD